jgi:hypothetical protein
MTPIDYVLAIVGGLSVLTNAVQLARAFLWRRRFSPSMDNPPKLEQADITDLRSWYAIQSKRALSERRK